MSKHKILVMLKLFLHTLLSLEQSQGFKMSVIAELMPHGHLNVNTTDHNMSNCSSLQSLAFSIKSIDAINNYPTALNKTFDMIFNYFCLTHYIQSVISCCVTL